MSELSEAQVLAVVTEVLRAELGMEGEVRPDADLQRDLAVDSLVALSVVVQLEDHFLVTLPQEASGEVRTVQDLAALVVREARREAVGGSAA